MPRRRRSPRRIRIVRMAARGMKPDFFEQAATATLKRQRLAITFWSRSKDEVTERVVSPQRLVFYRGNWYLDGWCHLRNEIRSFSLDGIREAKSLPDAAKTVAEKDLEVLLASSYGIFAGRPTAWATLHFTKTAARWVGYEKWHSQQRARHESDGSYILEVPYSDDTELVMDILEFGPDCKVLGPPALAEKVATRARETAENGIAPEPAGVAHPLTLPRILGSSRPPGPLPEPAMDLAVSPFLRPPKRPSGPRSG